MAYETNIEAAMNPQSARSKARWDQTVEANLSRLGKRRKLVQMDLDYHTFDLQLKDLLADANNSTLSRAFSKLSPIVSLLRQFTGAINVMSQTNDTVSLIWGAVQALIVVATNFSGILGDIAEMLSNMTKALPTFEQYQTEFSEAYELDEPLREMCDVYVKCCINAILILKTKRFSLIKHAFLPRIREEFESAKTRLQACRQNLKDSIDLASARLNRRMYNTLAETHLEVVKLSQKPVRKVLGVRMGPNSNFRGREEILEQLDEYLRPPRTGNVDDKTQRSCVVHGIGGVGKTQVALKYLYLHEKDYTYRFWVDSETGPKIIESIHHFVQMLMPNEVSMNQARSVDLMRDWWEQNESWLIVFDNAEDAGLLSYWPRCSHGSIIVTTQKATLSHMTAAEIKMPSLSETDGCKIILRHMSERSPDDMEVAKKISNELGGLPILLSHYAGFANHSRCTLRQLLSLLQEPDSFKHIWTYDSSVSSNFQYGAPMSKVWSLALQELSIEALQTLQLLAMLSSDSVPEAMLMGDWSNPRLSFLQEHRRLNTGDMIIIVTQLKYSAISFYSIRQSLGNRSLVEISDNTGTCASLSVHRSLQSYLMWRMDESDRPHTLQQVFDSTVEIVRKSFLPQSATQGPSDHNWNSWKDYLPQVLSLRTVYEGRKDRLKPSVLFASLLADAGTYLFEIGLRDDSISTFELGTEVCQGMEEQNDIVPIYANICAFHGASLAGIGLTGRRRARVPIEKAWQLRQRHLRTRMKTGNATQTDYLLYANSWNDLGVLLMQNEEFEPAMQCVQRGLEIKKRWITEECSPQMFGESYKNLSYILVHEGRNGQALQYAKKAYQLIEQANGPTASITLKAGCVYANVLLATGDFQAAKTVHKKILTQRHDLLGDDCFLTKESNYVLGEIYRMMGKYDKAERMFRGVLENAKRAGLGDGAIARCQYHLALVLRSKAKNVRDEEMATRMITEAEALETKEETYASTVTGQLTPEQLLEDRIRILDYMSSVWAARLSILGHKPFPIKPLITHIDDLLGDSTNEFTGI